MFRSDNQAGVHPRVMQALNEANQGRAGSYGDDAWTRKAISLVADVFETDDFDMYLVGTGGAANGIALSVLCPQWGAVLAHGEAHVIMDEGVGPEFFTSGARMVGLGSEADRLLPSHLEAAAARYSKDFVHGLQPRAVSMTNLSENGLVYRAEDIKALSAVCKRHGWGFHLDGARFGNAVVGTGQSPADLSWRSGVDALSFGLTKAGALAGEAVILFGQARQSSAPYLRKRAGQLFSKHRFLAAQYVAMLEDGLWLALAGHANTMAQDLVSAFDRVGAHLVMPCQGNEVFVRLTKDQQAALQAAGIGFYIWPSAQGQAEHDVCRFVASWQTKPEDVAAVHAALKVPG
jgi:threonine aldolase